MRWRRKKCAMDVKNGCEINGAKTTLLELFSMVYWFLFSAAAGAGATAADGFHSKF